MRKEKQVAAERDSVVLCLLFSHSCPSGDQNLGNWGGRRSQTPLTRQADGWVEAKRVDPQRLVRRCGWR